MSGNHDTMNISINSNVSNRIKFIFSHLSTSAAYCTMTIVEEHLIPIVLTKSKASSDKGYIKEAITYV